MAELYTNNAKARLLAGEKLSAAWSQTGSGVTADLDLTKETLGSLELAPSYAVYEWTGSGYVYDLEGNAGSSSSDFDAVTWTDTIPVSSIHYYHTNSAGQVDVLLLEDVTGNCYTYGLAYLYSDQEGISLGSGSMTAYNSAATITNSQGTTSKYLCALSLNSGSYVGVSLAQHVSGYTRISSVRTLTSSTAGTDDFYLDGEDWYVESGGTRLLVSGQVQIYLESAGSWLSGSDGLTAVLAQGGSFTLYRDSASSGAQVRVIVVS